MTGTQTLLARTVLGLAAASVSVLLASSRRLRVMSRQRFDRLALTAFMFSRLGVFGIAFFLLHMLPRGDVPAYYFSQAELALHRSIPYLNFVSSYAPLHPYLDAALLRLWPTPLAIMLFSVLVEMAILPLWSRIARDLLPELDVRIAALLYVSSPISLQFVAVDGQDNVIIAVLIASSLLLLLRYRSLLSGAVFGLSVGLIKFLPLLYAPAFFLALPRRWRWAAGAALITAVIYGGFLLLHAPVLQPLTAEGDLRSAGNLPYMIEALCGVSIPGRLSDAFLLLLLAALFALITWISKQTPPAVRMRVIVFGICALTLLLLIFSKKSWPPYLMLCLFPLGLLPLAQSHSRVRIWAFACFTVIAVTEHSVWASELALFSSLSFHQALVAHHPSALLFLVLEALLLIGYAWLLFEAVRQIFAAPRLAQLHRTAVDLPETI